MANKTHPAIELIKRLGFSVYMRSPSDEYCYYTDGTRIGYAQWSRLGTRVSSVHKPSSQVGTGFGIADEITEATVKAAMTTLYPHWASSADRAAVKKYRNWEEFLNKDAWNRGYAEV